MLSRPGKRIIDPHLQLSHFKKWLNRGLWAPEVANDQPWRNVTIKPNRTIGVGAVGPPESAQQELQPFEQEMEVITGGSQHGVNGIAGMVCKIIAADAVLGLEMTRLPVRWRRAAAARV